MRSLMAVCVLLSAVSLAVGQAPVKLDVEASWHVIQAGAQVPVRIRMLDSANRPVKAPRRFDILLQARLASGEVKPLRTVELAEGQLEKEVTIAPPGNGMVYIWAKNPELLPGGEFVSVAASPAPPVESKPPGALPAPTPEQPRPVEPPPPPRRSEPAPFAREIPRLALRFSPDRRFLADGKDAATVQAFLLTGPANVSGDIRLNVFDSSGTMQPTPLIIPKGQDSGRAKLTYTNPGPVTVEFLGSTPPAAIEGDKKLQIQFMPPIARAALEASPPAISLVDTADLVVTLTDDQGRPVASDAARHVTFAIQSGRGSITRKELDIPAGQFQARSTFEPAWLGQTTILAATPNLLTVAAPVQVSVPTGLLLFSLAGGLAGGYLSYLKRKRSGRRRIAIGIVTGFIFYWACLFVGLAAVGRGIVINPLSAFALSTLGGWMQTEVFTMLKSRVKVQA
jgi:hypothetical protein